MWCKYCRQDVPAIGSAKAGRACCTQCGTELSADEMPAAHRAALASAAEHGVDLSPVPDATPGFPTFDDWQLEQNFHHLQARVGNWKHSGRAKSKQTRPADAAPRWHVHGSHREIRRPNYARPRAAGRLSLVAWCVLSVGLTAFGCGATLLVWSFLDQRPELWTAGLPITVAGQVALLLGLVLQLERVWQNSRYAVRKLEQVDSQLHDLERTATMLNVTHGSAAQAFYAHMAEQANPELLLADLKGQIDLLAQSISRRSA